MSAEFLQALATAVSAGVTAAVGVTVIVRAHMRRVIAGMDALPDMVRDVRKNADAIEHVRAIADKAHVRGDQHLERIVKLEALLEAQERAVRARHEEMGRRLDRIEKKLDVALLRQPM